MKKMPTNGRKIGYEDGKDVVEDIRILSDKGDDDDEDDDVKEEAEVKETNFTGSKVVNFLTELIGHLAHSSEVLNRKNKKKLR